MSFLDEFDVQQEIVEKLGPLVVLSLCVVILVMVRDVVGWRRGEWRD